ncbi:MAG: Gfo/Idh/MocA family oxidoreductase [Candidatus Promineifilaceae bacterium]|nr:Gfo/Idh/MocA family oxidoreductase [Candidatus Promineifilaceae bacterium]
MAEKTGFTTMAGAKAEMEAPEVGIGMLGYAFMGKAHTNAYKKIPYMMYPPPAIPRLVAIAGRSEEAVAEAARRYGYEGYYTDWRQMLEDDRVDLFDNGGPNNIHAEPSIAAAEAGKHVFCEKPLARTAEEAKEMLDAVEKADVKHMVAFNYRFIPAIRQAKELIDSGALGQIYHYRAVYLQEWIMPHYGTPKIWRLDKEAAGSGALGDLGAHIIDLGRFLVGEPKSVSAMTRTFIKERPLPDGEGTGEVDVDDAFVAAVEFENGAIGTLEATRFAAGRKNYEVFEINGEKGTIRFNLERMNELEVFWVGEEPQETQGFHNALITEGYHPWWENWWPHGHIIGWEHSFVHELTHFLDCIVNNKDVAPYGATFEDGYRAAVIADAILESAEKKKQVDIQY